MPTYEYECKSCGHNFEAFQSMKDAPLSDCPECGKELRRLINGGSGIIFKGSGFYVTDKGTSKTHASGKSGKGSRSGESASAAGGASTSGGESKTACASCPAAASSGGSCPASEKAAG
jgi:putative FmdB family regulatory protein